MKVLICPNAFKGSMTAMEAAHSIADGFRRALPPGLRFEPVLLPIADGGDGTLETLVSATRGTFHSLEVTGPNGATVEANWGRLGGSQSYAAVIEMAQASGLRLLKPARYDPCHATTLGTGQLMRAALDAGCTRLVIGLGGSATTDAGAGMAQALGYRLLDAAGCELPPGGAALSRLDRILAPPDPFKRNINGSDVTKGVEVVAMTDVNNPLCGPDGSAAVYGPQKGATDEMVGELDYALRHFAKIVNRDLGLDVADVPGAGAAGGLGAGLIAFCGAHIESGAKYALDIVGFDGELEGGDLVITGEGRLDSQTARGKGIVEVTRRAALAGAPVIALAGSIEREAEPLLHDLGLTAAFTIVDGPCTVEQAMHDGYTLIGAAAERLARLIWSRSSNPRGC